MRNPGASAGASGNGKRAVGYCHLTMPRPPSATPLPRIARGVTVLPPDRTADASASPPPSFACLARKAKALHDRGPRPLAELLAELVAAHGLEFAADLHRRLDAYNRIPPLTYAAIGGRHLPPTPIHAVPA